MHAQNNSDIDMTEVAFFIISMPGGGESRAGMAPGSPP